MTKLLGEKIAQKREVLGWTQTKLGAIANVTQTTVSRIENGQVNVKLKDFLSIVRVLNMTPNEMVNSTEVQLRNYKLELYEARQHEDYKKMKEILNVISPIELSKNQELYVFYHFYNALLLIHEAHYEKALKEVEIAIKRLIVNAYTLPFYAELMLVKGTLLYKLEKNGKAYYDKSRQIIHGSLITSDNYKQAVKLHYNLATSYCRQNRYRIALEELNKANEIINEFHSTFLLLEIELSRLIFYQNINHIKLEEQKQRVEVLIDLFKNEEIYGKYKKLFIYE